MQSIYLSIEVKAVKDLVKSELSRIFARKKTVVFLTIFMILTILDSMFIHFFGQVIFNRHGVSAPLTQHNFPVALGKEIFLFLHFFIFPILFIDSFSGELSDGSYRFVMTKPVSRMHLLFSKWLSQIIITLLFFAIVIVIAYGYSFLFIESITATMFLHPTKVYSPIESFLFTMVFYGLLFLISCCVLMIASFVAFYIHPIISYVVTVGMMVIPVLIHKNFWFFILPGEEVLRIVHERDVTFLILTMFIITVGLLVNSFAWNKRDIYL